MKKPIFHGIVYSNGRGKDYEETIFGSSHIIIDREFNSAGFLLTWGDVNGDGKLELVAQVHRLLLNKWMFILLKGVVMSIFSLVSLFMDSDILR